MKISFLKLFYEFSNSKNHNALIYNKFKFILFNLKSTTYKNLNIEYDDSGIVVYKDERDAWGRSQDALRLCD